MLHNYTIVKSPIASKPHFIQTFRSKFVMVSYWYLTYTVLTPLILTQRLFLYLWVVFLWPMSFVDRSCSEFVLLSTK